MRPIHALLIAIAAGACSHDGQHDVKAASKQPAPSNEHTPATTPTTPPPSVAQPELPKATPVPPPAAPAKPTEQSNETSDLTLLQTIKQTLAVDTTLSLAARDIEVTTSGGRVTLRGSVPSEADHQRIVEIARTAAGQDYVDDLLEVPTTPK